MQRLAMALRIVRLGSPRHRDEGLRIGTVRRPPRGVPASQFAAQNWYDLGRLVELRERATIDGKPEPSRAKTTSIRYDDNSRELEIEGAYGVRRYRYVRASN